MRKSIDELNQVPKEYPDDRAKESAPLPDEFNRFAPAEEPKERKPSSVRKIMLYLAATGLVTLGVITPRGRLNPPQEEPIPVIETESPATAAEATPTPQKTPGISAAFVSEKPSVTTAAPVNTPTSAPTLMPTPVPTQEPTETPAPTLTPTPTPTETPTPTPTAMPKPTSIQRMTGEIHITIYSEVFNMDTAMRGEYPSEILAEETLPAETFTEYELPPLPEQEDCKALGYVLLSTGGAEYLESLYREGAMPAPIGTAALGSVLTADDLEIVPKDIEGVYHAEIHVVWLMEESPYRLEFYDGAMFGAYYIAFPIYSEQLCYLAPFPIPEREGKTFAGWCDADGHMIDAVTWYDFFEKLPNATRIDDRDFDKPIPCRVYACWSDGTGGAPEPTPVPTLAPTPAPTPKPTQRPTPTPTPVKKYSVTCKYCTFSGGGYSGASSGSVPENTTISLSGETNSSEAYFYIEYASGYSKTVKAKYVKWEDGYYWFKCSFTVKQDISVISFYGVIN